MKFREFGPKSMLLNILLHYISGPGDAMVRIGKKVVAQVVLVVGTPGGVDLGILKGWNMFCNIVEAREIAAFLRGLLVLY